MSAQVPHSDLWFEEAFDTDTPRDIRETATFFCRQFGIRGTSDPMYIANLIALELGRGDGKSAFFKTPHPSMLDRQETFQEDVRRAAERLRHAYASSIHYTAKVDGWVVKHLAAILANRLDVPGRQSIYEKFDSIQDIADQLRPIQAKWKSAYDALMKADFSRDDYDAFVRLTQDMNTQIEQKIAPLAQLTGNSDDHIRSFRPISEISLWFYDKPADFLAQVGKYQSFNHHFLEEIDRLNKDESSAQQAILEDAGQGASRNASRPRPA